MIFTELQSNQESTNMVNTVLQKNSIEEQQNMISYSYSNRQSYFEFEYNNTDSILKELSNLALNWDGYNALPIKVQTTQNVKAALNIFRNIIPFPDLTPNPNGTISLEWETTFGNAHLEIGKTNFGLFIIPNQGKTVYFDSELINTTDNLWLMIAISILSYLYPTACKPVNQTLINIYGRSA